MRRGLAATVIVLALSASALARSALAQPVESPAGELRTETPLQVRAAQPLTLAPAPARPHFTWVLIALAGAAGAGAWVWKKRGVRPIDVSVPELRILRRTSAGFRCELLLVELQGQRMLLGVTAHAIQNLYIVPEGSSEETTDSPGAPAPDKKPPSAALTRESRGGGLGIEGQARGLLNLGDRS